MNDFLNNDKIFNNDNLKNTLIIILFYIVYRLILKPTVLPSIKTYEPMSKKSIAKKKKYFPPPYPNGWFRLCSTKDVENNNIHSVSAMGKDFVVFRDPKTKEIAVLDAYCPHLGAHLGEGGELVECSDGKMALQCPFHEWRFDTNGKVVDIPYSRREVPERAKTKKHHHRVICDKMIYVWFHAEGKEPQWEPQYHLDVSDKNKFYYVGMKQMFFNQHVQEMHMNSADYYHFQTLHKPIPFPILEHILFGQHRLKAEYFENAIAKGAPDTHVCFFREEMLKIFLFGKISILPSFLLQSVDTRVTFEGPMIVHFSVKTIFGELRMVKTLLPLDNFKLNVEARWFAQQGVPRFIANMMMLLAGRALEQDRQVWEAKIHRPKPMLVSGDGPFPAFKRYYDQFYTESSDKIDEGGNFDW